MMKLAPKAAPLIRPLLRLAGERRALAAWRQRSGVTVLAYHEICSEPSPYLAAPLMTSTERFAREMAWLKEHFDMITLEEAIRRLQEGTGRSHAVAVTFDDGFAGVRGAAYPILERLRIPATIFLNGKFFVGEDLSTRVKAEYLLARVSLPVLQRVWPRLRSKQELIRVAKDGSAQTQRMVDRLFHEAGGRDDQAIHLHEPDLLSMSPELIHVGNHGWSHRWLAGLPAAEQEQELLQTAAVLSPFPHARKLFAAPFGTEESVDAVTIALAERFFDGWIMMLGGGINRFSPSGKAPRFIRRNAVADTKPALPELVWLNELTAPSLDGVNGQHNRRPFV